MGRKGIIKTMPAIELIEEDDGWRCPNCGYFFRALVGYDKPPTGCEDCGASLTGRRIIRPIRTCVCCDVLLMGGATVHKPGCEIGKLIDEKFPSIRCPRCGMRSYNPHDIDQRYCGNCHAFHDDLIRQALEAAE